eukprot:333246-Pelagomonas_calceolata.AAC.2
MDKVTRVTSSWGPRVLPALASYRLLPVLPTLGPRVLPALASYRLLPVLPALAVGSFLEARWLVSSAGFQFHPNGGANSSVHSKAKVLRTATGSSLPEGMHSKSR